MCKQLRMYWIQPHASHLLHLVHIMNDLLFFFWVLLFHPAAVSQRRRILIKLKTPVFLSPPVTRYYPVARNTWKPKMLLSSLNLWGFCERFLHAQWTWGQFSLCCYKHRFRLAGVWFVCFVTSAKYLHILCSLFSCFECCFYQFVINNV